MGRALLLIGAVATLAGVVAAAAQILSDAQPWGATLSDNMLFAKLIPFVLGFGLVVGAARALGPAGPVEQRDSDGAIRRFSPGTAALHWIATVGFVLALVTGAWQYLKGVLDVESPVFMPYVYRVHYVGATLLLFATSSMLTTWWVGGARALLVPGGQRIRHLRGLAQELPRPLGSLLAGFFGFDPRREPPPVEQFTYYEKTVSFPTWIVLLGLIVVTGLLKAMRYLYPIPGEVLWWASALHVAGLVLLAVKLLDHLRYVLSPARWPLLTAMATTWIGERYVQRRHPAWYAAIQREQTQVADNAASPKTPPSAPASPLVPSPGGRS